MLFGNLNAQVDVTTNGINIDGMCVVKLLGVLIYEKLNRKDHMENVKSKLSKSTAILYKCGQLIDPHYLHMLYSSLFLRYISYCFEICETHPSVSIVLSYSK